MFTIKEATSLTQWEQGILLLNEDMQSGDAVRFVNEFGLSGTMTAYSLNGDIVVEIPNRLLQFDAVLTACIAYTDERTVFDVVSAEKPPDYEFINNESSNTASDDLPIASKVNLGCVIAGDNINIRENGTIWCEESVVSGITNLEIEAICS